MPDGGMSLMMAVAANVATQAIGQALFSPDGSNGGASAETLEAAQQAVQDRADEMEQFWVDTYKDLELLTINEVSTRANYVPQYQAQQLRAEADVVKIFSIKRKQAMACLPPRCVGMRRNTEAEMFDSVARLVNHAKLAAYQTEDTKTHTINSQILVDKFNIDKLGRNVSVRADHALISAAGLHAAAAQRAQAAFSASSQALGAIANRLVPAALDSLRTSQTNTQMDAARQEFRSAERTDSYYTESAPAAMIEAAPATVDMGTTGGWFDAGGSEFVDIPLI